MQKTDYRPGRLLGARGNRLGDSRAADRCDEIAPSHSAIPDDRGSIYGVTSRRVKWRKSAAARASPTGADHDIAGIHFHHPRGARRYQTFRAHTLWRTQGGRHPGADWQIVGPDGVIDLRARYAVETHSGARILVTSDGLRHGPAEVLAALARGEAVDPARYYFRTAMRFETGDPAFAWLNRILALATGARERHAVRLDVFEVV